MIDYKLSIIVAVYNAEKYLKNCIEALINQEYKNIEIILVDDGSSDKSKTICDYYQKEYSIVKVCHKENEGCYSAWNKGLDMAKGELIGFVDNDDIVQPNIYTILINNLIKYDADISSCGRYRNIDGNVQTHNEKNIVSVYNRNEALFELLGVTKRIRPAVWDKIYKKEVFDGLRFPNTYFEDAGLTFKLISSVNKVVYTEAQLYRYTVHKGSMITKTWSEKQLKSYFDINDLMDEYFSIIKDNQNLYNSYIWRIEFSIEAYERISCSKEITDKDKKIFMRYIKHLCSMQHLIKMKIPVKKKLRYLIFPYMPYLSNRILKVSFDLLE